MAPEFGICPALVPASCDPLVFLPVPWLFPSAALTRIHRPPNRPIAKCQIASDPFLSGRQSAAADRRFCHPAQQFCRPSRPIFIKNLILTVTANHYRRA